MARKCNLSLFSYLTNALTFGPEYLTPCCFQRKWISFVGCFRPHRNNCKVKNSIGLRLSQKGYPLNTLCISSPSLSNIRWCGHECITHQECWKCGTEIEPDMEQYFCVCGVVQPPIKNRSYFQTFGIEEKFDVNQKQLKTKYQKLQALLHPDRYSQKCETEKNFSVEHSVMVSRAYQTLTNPLKRGLYMLHLKTDDLEKEIQVDNAFLLETFELSEAVEDAKDDKELREIETKNKKNIDDLVEKISNSFKSGDVLVAKDSLARLKYLITISDKIYEQIGYNTD